MDYGRVGGWSAASLKVPVCGDLSRVEGSTGLSEEGAERAEPRANREPGEDPEEPQEGYEDGIAWARKWASPSELREIADLELGSGAHYQDHSIVKFFAAKHKQHVIGVCPPDSAYWEGFIDGVRAVRRS